MNWVEIATRQWRRNMCLSTIFQSQIDVKERVHCHDRHVYCSNRSFPFKAHFSNYSTPRSSMFRTPCVCMGLIRFLEHIALIDCL